MCVFFFFSCYNLICLLFSCPLLGFDLSEFETSVDSRCTMDSADSAFIGRRYWFLFLASPFSPFLSSNRPLCILSHTGSKITNQPAGQHPSFFTFLFLSFPFSLFCLFGPPSISPHYSPITLQYSMFIFMSVTLYAFIWFCKYVLFIFFTLQTPHLCLFILLAYI